MIIWPPQADRRQSVLGDRPDEKEARVLSDQPVVDVKAALLAEARAIHDEDIASTKTMGKHGGQN
ncbi:MAG: hypothetical protein U0412_10440 [Nitrospira sp.]